jgi:hypothetical protein
MSLYKNCSSQIITGNAITNPFPIRRGVRQGNTVAPLLFILVIDILLNNMEKQNSGYQLQNVKIPAQALSDDITILTNDAEQMEQAWNIICQWSERYSLLINTKPGKTIQEQERHSATPTYPPEQNNPTKKRRRELQIPRSGSTLTWID